MAGGIGGRAHRIRSLHVGPEGLGEKNDVDEDMGSGGVQSKRKGRSLQRPGFGVIGDGTAIPEEQQLGDIGLSFLSAICSVAEQTLPGANVTIVSDIYTILNSLTKCTTFSTASLKTNTLDSLAERCMMVEAFEGGEHFLYIINTLQFASAAQRFNLFLLHLSFTHILNSREIKTRHLTKQSLCKNLANDLNRKGRKVHFRTLERYFQCGISFCMLGGAGSFD